MRVDSPSPLCDCSYRSPRQSLGVLPPWNATQINTRPDGLCDVWVIGTPTQDAPGGVMQYEGAFECPAGYGLPPPPAPPALVPAPGSTPEMVRPPTQVAQPANGSKLPAPGTPGATRPAGEASTGPIPGDISDIAVGVPTGEGSLTENAALSPAGQGGGGALALLLALAALAIGAG